MTTIILLTLVWFALLAWLLTLERGCKHANLKGVANYYDRDLKAFIHLKECEDCGVALITHER